MNNLLELKGAFSLLTKFDIDDDAEKIDSVICHAIEKGLDIESYDYLEEVYI